MDVLWTPHVSPEALGPSPQPRGSSKMGRPRMTAWDNPGSCHPLPREMHCRQAHLSVCNSSNVVVCSVVEQAVRFLNFSSPISPFWTDVWREQSPGVNSVNRPASGADPHGGFASRCWRAPPVCKPWGKGGCFHAVTRVEKACLWVPRAVGRGGMPGVLGGKAA